MTPADPARPATPTETPVLCDFYGGPLHDADIAIQPGPNGLPLVLVAYLDKDDYWAGYVRLHERFWRVPPQPTYTYNGSADSAEIERCPRVPGYARAGDPTIAQEPTR